MACRCLIGSARALSRRGAIVNARPRLNAAAIHSSSAVLASQPFKLPAMSPTMEAGTISSWEVKEGDKFSQGDVLLKLETDKATMDVEAQDDGVMGKILVEAGASDVPVGILIAILAEEGDDLSSLEIPSEDEAKPKASPSKSEAKEPAKDEAKDEKAKAMKTDGYAVADQRETPTPDASPAKAHHVHPKHPQPLLPSVLFLLAQEGIEDATKIKATGKGGRLTKSDVLLHLGRLKDVRGTDTASRDHSTLIDHSSKPSKGKKAAAPVEVLDGPSFRRLVLAGLSSAPARLAAAAQASSGVPLSAPKLIGFDDILKGYTPAPSPAAKLDLSLAKAPRISSGLSKNDPLRQVLEA